METQHYNSFMYLECSICFELQNGSWRPFKHGLHIYRGTTGHSKTKKQTHKQVELQ